MKLLDLLNYVIAAVVLLVIGYVAKTAGLWSFYTSVTIPDICFAGACYQNPKSICPQHQMLLPRSIRG